MGLRKTWLEEHGLAKSACADGTSPVWSKPTRDFVGFGEFRIAAYEIPEDIDCASNVVVLPEDKANWIRASVYLGSRLMASFSSRTDSYRRSDLAKARPRL